MEPFRLGGLVGVDIGAFVDPNVEIPRFEWFGELSLRRILSQD